MNDALRTGKSEVTLLANRAELSGSLSIPPAASGLVLFAHGSGSSRLSPRNRFVADSLEEGGLATLLFDLLTPAEIELDRLTARLRFDIGHLAERLEGALEWALRQPALNGLRVGLFGASTGAAAALTVAARRPEVVGAVVCRGGRPDLAVEELWRVAAPTLLVVGSLDVPVLALNREAARHLQGKARLEVVRGATHLFEESGTLEEVARLAREWFKRHLESPAPE